MAPDNDDSKGRGEASARGRAETVVRYAVADLLRGGKEAILVHDGAEYRLRITANGRLILTK